MSYRYGRPKPVAATMNRLPAYILLIGVALFIVADLLLGFSFNWVDYALVIIMALFGLKGYYKGLINTAFSLLGYLLGLVGAFVFSPKLALITMQKTALGKSIGDKINDILPVLSTVNTVKSAQTPSTFDTISQIPAVNQAFSENPIIKYLVSATNSAAETSSMYADTVTTANELIVFSILKVLAMVVLFIVIKLVVVLIGKLLSSILGTSALLGTANRSAGMFIGFVAGAIVCYIVFVFAIPTLGSIKIINVPETYTQSLMLNWFNQLLLLLS